MFEEKQEARQRTMKTIHPTQDLDLGLIRLALTLSISSLGLIQGNGTYSSLGVRCVNREVAGCLEGRKVQAEVGCFSIHPGEIAMKGRGLHTSWLGDRASHLILPILHRFELELKK